MILVDSQIKALRENLIAPFCDTNVSSICYDLTVESFSAEVQIECKEIELAPGDSVLVKSKEVITLPNDIVGKVVLRNSRIRQGLALAAPVYQPGHHTAVFFRVTNASRQAIKLDTENGIASIMFERLDVKPEHPYDGAFQREFDYRGMGSYTSKYSGDMTDIEKKVSDVKSIEKNMYGNVLSLMAIFVGIFSLINTNITLVMQSGVLLKTLLTLDLTTIGSIGFLIAIINTILPNGKHRTAIWAVCAIAFITAIALQFIPCW